MNLTPNAKPNSSATLWYRRGLLLLVAGLLLFAKFHFEGLGNHLMSAPDKAVLSGVEAKAIGDEYFEVQRFPQALEYYQMAVAAAPENSEYLRRLGVVETNLTRYQQAEAHLKQAVAIDVNIKHAIENLADDWYYLGRIYRLQSKYTLAHDSITKALELARQGPFPEVKKLKYNTDLAANHIWLGQYELAQQSIDKALALVPLVAEPEGQEVAAIYSTRGLLYKRMGKDQSALADFNQALAMDMVSLGPHHDKIARQRNNLGGLYETLGQYAMAHTQYKTALGIFVKIYGHSHHSVSAIYNNIANVLMRQSKYAAAQTQLEKAMEVNKSLKTYKSRLVMFTLINLGEVHTHVNELVVAQDYMRQAELMCLDLFGEDHHNTAYIWVWQGDLKMKMGQADKAETYYTKALAIYRRVYGKEHEKTKTLAAKLAALLR